jgi:hypothetical protein
MRHDEEMRHLLLPVLLPFALAAAPPATGPSVASQPMENLRCTLVFELLDKTGEVERLLPPTQIVLIGDQAMALGDKESPRITFDLKKKSIKSETGDGGTLEELQKRAADQRERVLKSIDAYKEPDRIRRLYDPQLKAEQNGQALKLSNEVMSYSIQLDAIAQPQRERLYLVQRLQDYLNPKIDTPPFASLAVTDELEKRQSYARESTVTMRAPDGETYSVRSRLTIGTLDDAETKRLGDLLARQK